MKLIINNQMDKNKIKILVILFITILILFILFVMFFRNQRRSAEVPVVEQEITSQELPDQIDDNGPVKLEPRPEEELKPMNYTAEDLKMMAFSFAERLGSYSNQASFANITELKMFMTPSMQNWADSYVTQMKKDFEYSGHYEGVSTRALTGKIIDFDAENKKAEILVHTQKTKTDDIGKEDVSQEYITIRYVYMNNKWLVDYAKWELTN